MNTYRKKNYRNKRNYSGRPRRTVDNYHQPSPPDRESIPVSRHTLTKPDVEAVVEALLSGTLINGQELERFESLLAKLTHSDHAIAVASGSAALHAALACLKLEPEDEVITSTLNDFQAANMIRMVGAKPVLVDCHQDTLTIDPNAAVKAITENTKAILANNFAGHPADLAALRELCEEHNLVLIEDASQGLGGKYRGHYVGNQADITCFSFQPSMAITTCEGGAITTNNRTIADWIRQFCNQGLPLAIDKEVGHESKLHFPGMNYRLNDVLSALGRSQLTRLDRHIERRRSIAQVYQQKLNNQEAIKLPHAAQWADHAYHLFPIQLTGAMVNHRSKILAELKSQGIETSLFNAPLHQTPAYSDQADDTQFPNAEAFYGRSLCLPLYPDLSYKDIERITDQLAKLITKYQPKPAGTQESATQPKEVSIDQPQAKQPETQPKTRNDASQPPPNQRQDSPRESRPPRHHQNDRNNRRGPQGNRPSGPSQPQQQPRRENPSAKPATQPKAEQPAAVAEAEKITPRPTPTPPPKKDLPREEPSKLRIVPKEAPEATPVKAVERPKDADPAVTQPRTTKPKTRSRKSTDDEEASKDKPKRTSRTTRKSTSTSATEKPKARRTTTARKTKASDEPEKANGSGVEATEDKPKKRTTRKRTTTKKTPEKDGET